jgi:hypothetical protein
MLTRVALSDMLTRAVGERGSISVFGVWFSDTRICYTHTHTHTHTHTVHLN